MAIKYIEVQFMKRGN